MGEVDREQVHRLDVAPRRDDAFRSSQHDAPVVGGDLVVEVRRDVVVDELLEVVVVLLREVVRDGIAVHLGALPGRVVVLVMPDEPTRYHFIGFVVLLHRLLGDLSRFLVPFGDDVLDIVPLRIVGVDILTTRIVFIRGGVARERAQDRQSGRAEYAAPSYVEVVVILRHGGSLHRRYRRRAKNPDTPFWRYVRTTNSCPNVRSNGRAERTGFRSVDRDRKALLFLLTLSDTFDEPKIRFEPDDRARKGQ